MSACFLFTLAFCQIAFPPVQPVQQLDGNDFTNLIEGSHVPLFVELMAPWCGHCKDLAPEMDLLAHTFKRFASQVSIVTVDADANRNVAAKQGLTRFPMLKWFPENSSQGEVYEGPHTAAEMVKFVGSKLGINVKPKHVVTNLVNLTAENFDKVVTNPTSNVLVMFTAPWCGHCNALKPTYDMVAAAFADEPNCIVATLDADKYRNLADSFRIGGLPSFLFFSGARKEPETYTMPREEDFFLSFLNERCSARRAHGGQLEPEVGREPSLDLLVDDFMHGDKEYRGLIFRQAQQLASESSIYIKTMKAVLDVGDIYLAREVERLENMLEFDILSPAQITNISRRLNILFAFVEAVDLPENKTVGDGIVLAE